MSKGPEAFRTISEVAEELDLPQHVLRFWETRFGQIRPMKRGGGRRYYRPDDVGLLRGIRHLLYGEGYTIKGVQRILKEQGARVVVAIGEGGALPALAAIAPDERQPAGSTSEDWAETAADTSTEFVDEGDEPVEIAPEPAPAEAAPRRFLDRLRPETRAQDGLSKEELRRLQATMADLLECKRLLDQAR